jgi:hypothetical protein
MRAGNHNFYLEQGTNFIRNIYIEAPIASPPTDDLYEAYNLVGFKARMQVRRTIDATTFFLELTTENGAMVVASGVDQNDIAISVSASVSASLTSDGVYDLEIVAPNGEVSRVLQGNFYVSKGVTR